MRTFASFQSFFVSPHNSLHHFSQENGPQKEKKKPDLNRTIYVAILKT